MNINSVFSTTASIMYLAFSIGMVVSFPVMAQLSTSNLLLHDFVTGQTRQITDTKGYTNQPYFTQDSQTLRYTEQVIALERIEMTATEGARITAGEGTQMDIFAYHIKQAQHQNLTQSAWSEYSATPYLNGFSAIAVDANNAQWLYAFSTDGMRKEPLIPQEPIGYHAWLDEQHLAVFILGDTPAPHSLQIVALNSTEVEIVDVNIGASIYSGPADTVLYSQKLSGEKQHRVLSFDRRTSQIMYLGNLPEGSDYFYYANGKMLVANKTKVLKAEFIGGHALHWETLLDLSKACDGQLTRLAQAPNERYLAVVCQG